jgi:PAS domain-containing protein
MSRRGALVLRLVPLDLPPAGPPQVPGTPGEVRPWVDAVAAAADPCLVLLPDGRLAAASASAAALFGRPGTEIIGRRLLEVLAVIDFTAAARPDTDYAERIAPLLVLRSGAPARGLLRIRRDDGSRLTLDAVAAPLRGPAGAIAGSVAFLAAVPVS